MSTIACRCVCLGEGKQNLMIEVVLECGYVCSGSRDNVGMRVMVVMLLSQCSPGQQSPICYSKMID